MNLFGSIGDAIMAAVVAIGVLITGLLSWNVKRANKKATEATERAEEAERQVQEAQAVNTATERAHVAVEKVRKKPLKKPAKNRSDFESQ